MTSGEHLRASPGALNFRKRETADAHASAHGVRKEYRALTLSRMALGRHAHWASVLDAHFAGDKWQGVEERSSGVAPEAGGCKTPKADKKCVLEVVTCAPLADEDRSEVLLPRLLAATLLCLRPSSHINTSLRRGEVRVARRERCQRCRRGVKGDGRRVRGPPNALCSCHLHLRRVAASA